MVPWEPIFSPVWEWSIPSWPKGPGMIKTFGVLGSGYLRESSSQMAQLHQPYLWEILFLWLVAWDLTDIYIKFLCYIMLKRGRLAVMEFLECLQLFNQRSNHSNRLIDQLSFPLNSYKVSKIPCAAFYIILWYQLYTWFLHFPSSSLLLRKLNSFFFFLFFSSCFK